MDYKSLGDLDKGVEMRKSRKETQLPFLFDRTPINSLAKDSAGKVFSLCEARSASVKASVKKQEEEVIDKIVALSRKYKW